MALEGSNGGWVVVVSDPEVEGNRSLLCWQWEEASRQPAL